MPANSREEALAYFLAELESLRAEAGAFADAHPHVAAQLRLGRDPSDDPHVERLIEAFAFLTGRLRSTVAKQLPRLGGAMLETLYPHLTAPTPSMGIVQFRVDPGQSRRAHGFVVKRGAELTVQTNLGATCRFRTGWSVVLWPVRVVAADAPNPELFPFPGDRGDRRHLLRIRLEALGKAGEGGTFAEAPPPALRFRIGGPRETAAAVYQALFRTTSPRRPREIWAFAHDGDASRLEDAVEGRAFKLPPDALRAVGFAEDEALLPQPASAHHGHRLMREFFVFPEKFLFFDVRGLSEAANAARTTLDLVFALDEAAPQLNPARAFELGATPVINLFPRVSEPIRLDGKRVEYPVTPDYRQEQSTEIYEITKVTSTAIGNVENATIPPFFSVSHKDAVAPDRAWWTARRQPASASGLAGSEMLISFRDTAYQVAQPAGEVAFAHLLCTNRGMAEKIPIGREMDWDPATAPGRLGVEIDTPVKRVVWRVRPTAQIPAPPVAENLWRLVSHISVNQLSFVDGADASATLREHLRLYCPSEAKGALKQIDGVVEISSARITRRFGRDGWRGFCRGIEVTAHVDKESYSDEGSAYLFFAVLARFFGLYAAVNSFCTLRIIRSEREGEWAKWPPMAGEQILM